MKIFVFLVALLMAGCATTNTSGRVYSGALEQQRVQAGKILGIRHVDIKPKGYSTGKYVGAAIGTATGYALTSNWGFRGAAAILGGALGGQIGQSMTHRPRAGAQIFVKLRDETVVSVVQDNDQALRVGQKVYLIRSSDGYSISSM